MVIEQYTITNKYNFPQANIDTILPQRFFEQSLNSLKQVHNQPLQFNCQDYNPLFSQEQTPSNILLKQQAISLKPNYQEALTAAVDTSIVKIGETTTGLIIAIRGATAWRQNRQYKYSRLGPFVFHITEDNKKAVYNSLEHAYFNATYGSMEHSTPSLMQMPTRLAGLLERWMQTMLAKTINNGIILFDGSLTAGTIDTPTQRLKEILSNARRNNNIVFAFSKATALRSGGVIITDLLPNRNPPYLLETSGFYFKPPIVLLGDVYVARLNKANMAFRLDIDKATELEERIGALERLLGNDVYRQSYPETLRLSHILCTFTANEVIAIKHFITRKHGIQIINRPDMHRLLFGPFGRELSA